MTTTLDPTSPGEPVLAVRNLTVRFDRAGQAPMVAVRDLSLTIERGSTCVVVGESGSGKSVTSLAIMRLVEYGGGIIDQGEIWFRRPNGDLLDLAHADTTLMRKIRGAEIGMIFQEPMTSLNPVMSVGDQLVEAILLHQPGNHRTAVAEAGRLLDHVRIPDAVRILKRYPHELSGGMRQRVMIAMALACRPRLLIADEPTTALDVTVQAQILHLIRSLQAEMNMGVLLITHDMGVVAECADQVVVMRGGDELERGDVKRIFSAPTHPYTRALLAAVPKLGDMHGTDMPQRFSLPGQADDADHAASSLDGPHTKATPPPKLVGDTVLSVRKLVTRFDVKSGLLSRVRQRVHAVEQVSFDLHSGETLGLVGESGCGKTTTGRTLLGLAKAISGHAYFDGVDLLRDERRARALMRKNVQLVFQDPFASLNPRLRIGQTIAEPMEIQGLATRREAFRRAQVLLERVGLHADMATRWPHQLSGGQRQRVCIARALATNPRVLIADESVSALDVSVQAQIINLLIDLQEETRVSCLFISHDMAVIERISHRVAVMYLGQIVEIGPRRAIFENAQHPYTRKLMQAVPIADPTRRHRATPELVDLPSPLRAVDDEPRVEPLIEVGPGHFVARHAIGGPY